MIELLAPAGNMEALKAAVESGADAIYLSGKMFGARAYANNFDEQNLKEAIEFAHLRNVKIHVTVNTLVDNSEIPALADYLRFLYEVGADAILVQDLGAARLAHQIVPNLPLHASTQMTVNNLAGVLALQELGFSRVVLSREVTLKDIIHICRNCNVEIEVFAHGALCVCYSGQCLMSSMIGGRSGNRGRCAQPCRLPYRLLNSKGDDMLEGKDAGQYLLSPKDMNTLEILPQLIESGVVSYKIEGRMKRPEYVAIVVDAYRRAMDSYIAGDYSVPAEDFANIEQIFNRDFTTAYMVNRPGREMMSDRRPNNRGVLVGRVLKLDKQRNKAVIKLDKELHLGDGLEFWVTVGGRVGTTVTEMLSKGESVSSAAYGEQVTIDVPKGVRLNDRVFRTLDSKLMSYARQFFGPDAKKRIAVDAVVTAHVGQPMTVTLTDEDGNVGYGETDFIVEEARKRALDYAVVHKQLDRMGTTEYFLNSLNVELDDNVMVPMSEMNEARRMACEALDAARLEAFAPARKPVHKHNESFVPNAKKRTHDGAVLTVHCDSLGKVNAALQAGAERILFGGDCFTHIPLSDEDYRKATNMVRKAGRQLAFATPRIVKEAQLKYFDRLFALWSELEPDFVYISNNGLWSIAVKHGLKPVADMSLNIFNYQSLEFWKEQGAVGAVISSEMTMGQVEHLASVSPVPIECMIQGRLEMMVSEYCVGGSFLGDLHKGACKFNCSESLFLEDRKDAKFPIATDQFCRMHVLNAHELSMTANVQLMAEIGVSSLRIDGRNYDEQRLGELITMYKKILGGAVEAPDNLPGTTRGHYFRGVM